MTVVNPIAQAAQASAQTAQPSVATPSPESLDYDAFLRLLVEQMKNQDPLEPVSETEYVAQLATFSNVEQNIITNERLLALITTNTLSDAQALIGRDIATPDGTEGKVESVEIVGNQIYANLDTGAVVAVGDGMRLS